jgi:hypothetical protein
MEEVKYPSLFMRIYICLFKERKKWKIARAASILRAYAFNTMNDQLAEIIDPLETKLWKEIYKDYQ